MTKRKVPIATHALPNRRPTPRAERNAEIRKRYFAGGVTMRALAAEHGVTYQTIHEIIKKAAPPEGVTPLERYQRPTRRKPPKS